ncbi:MAG: hypothetical protein AAF579_02950 [Cyanobacteria bacterium P01_C01_bin.118]
MVNASGHIEQQLSKLQTQTADIATEIETLVDSYLDVLSQASKRQLVLAAYHICTQIYPDKFLELSLSQRDRLQKHLRELGNHIQTQLNEKWANAKRLSLKPAEEDGLAVIRQLFLEAASAREQTDTEHSDSQQTGIDDANKRSEESEPPMDLAEANPDSQNRLFAELRTLIGSESPNIEENDSDDEDTGPLQPAQIMRRQILIEKAIRDVLKNVSEKANTLLQKAQVMPELPQALLAAAADSERLGHTPMKTPNLVRLSIKVMHDPGKGDFSKHSDEPSGEDSEEDEAEDEAQTDEWPDEPEISAAIITREEIADADDNNPPESISMPRFLQLESLPDFVMIHLRLSEIEFAETNVAVWRSRIRKKMRRLKQVGYAYKDAERQLAIAQAEDAWRASWTNE